MANSKNTIQNIPLASELCMNALKTEVKQFQGYNEKNTTLYGGTLSPMWDNKKELPFDKDNSYTFFNSKGQDFTLVKEDDEIHLYEGNDRVSNVRGTYLCKTEELKVPLYTVGAAKLPNGDLITVVQNVNNTYPNNRFKIYANDVELDTQDGSTTNEAIDARVWLEKLPFSGENVVFLFVGVITSLTAGATATIFCYSLPDYNLVSRSSGRGLPVESGVVPLLTGDGWVFYFMNTSGKIKNSEVKTYRVSFDTSSGLFSSWQETAAVGIESGSGVFSSVPFHGDNTTIELQQCCCRSTSSNGYENLWKLKVAPNNYEYSGFYTTDADGFIPTPIRSYENGVETSAYWQNGHLISISDLGRPIDECLGYGKDTFNNITYNNTSTITYVKKDGSFHAYTRYVVNVLNEHIKDYLKGCVTDGRYVFLSHALDKVDIFDIETGLIRPEHDLGRIISSSPWFTLDEGVTVNPNPTGVVFAAGVNAGYTVNNSPFVGYLPNPFIGYNFCADEKVSGFKSTTNYFQTYYTIGDTAQSAEYQGYNPEYQGTTYPIDPNGNVVLPISMNAQIIKGYSNNDMVKEGTTVYPLMYWNNNQKVYAYYLLAGIENITNVFSLQGQQYAVDDENIYAVAFNGGIVSQVQSVSYKKNLTFLGTLPTQAVFWSDYNKTFYAFTGDRILSKMFEASDIHKILYVGQNPSSLSLWVCTDTGIYILSDTDQFRLEYISKMVGFQPKTTLLLTEGEENNEVHAVSLYLDEGEEGEMVPVKLKTSYYGLGNEMKAVMDCWYLRLFDENNTKGYVKAKVHTITDITRHTEEKTFEVNPSDYDENHIVYLRFQPKYQECVSMQLELETNLGIYQISLGVNTTDSTAQVSKFNF